MGNFINKLSNYQVIPRELIFDNTLSDRARFVYCYMASKPNGWDFYMNPMAKEIGYSVETLRKYINELVENGWLVKGEQKNEGLFGAVTYTLNDSKTLNKEEASDGIKNSDTEKFRYGEKPTQYNIDTLHSRDDSKGKEERDKSLSKKDKRYDADAASKDDEFVERMYAMYPTKCPIKNRSLGKSTKDKDRIRKLMKIYSKEEIEFVISNEVNQKFNKSWMSNFSTFLNNFPDPTQIDCEECAICAKENEDSNKVIISGIEYR